MKVIILAAGRGKRMESFTDGLPKCLLKLGNENILSREVRLLKEAGVKEGDIFVVGGYKYESLEEISPNLIINNRYDVTDNSYSLGLALQTIGNDDDVLILDADLCFERTILDEIISDNRENILLCKTSEDQIESTGIISDSNNRVEAIGKQYPNTGLVYISIFKIGKSIINDFINALITERSGQTWYTLAITEICAKHPFFIKTTAEKWHEIDFEDDYIETLSMFGLE